MIKAIDATQGGPPPEPSGAELAPAAATPLLSLEERRQILARIVRTNALDCFDDTGAFDIARAKQVLPPGAIRHIDVDETTRVDAEGEPVTQRHIRLRLVDPLSALRLDDILERRGQSSAASSFRYPNPHPASREYSFNLLRDKTLALDDALQSIEELKKQLAEVKDRELQLSKKLNRKQRQRGTPLQETPGSSMAPSSQGSQGDSGCQPVVSTTLSAVEGPPSAIEQNWSLSSQGSQSDTGCQPVDSTTLNAVEASSPASGGVPEHIARKRKASMARRLELEVEHARNTSGHLGFSNWLRIHRPEQWAKIQSQNLLLKHSKTGAAHPTRSPP